MLVVHFENCFLSFTIEAGELLVGYLKVIKAHFFAFKDHREITKGYYREIVRQLQYHTKTIGLNDITRLVNKMGCISDWKYQGENYKK